MCIIAKIGNWRVTVLWFIYALHYETKYRHYGSAKMSHTMQAILATQSNGLPLIYSINCSKSYLLQMFCIYKEFFSLIFFLHYLAVVVGGGFFFCWNKYEFIHHMITIFPEMYSHASWRCSPALWLIILTWADCFRGLPPATSCDFFSFLLWIILCFPGSYAPSFSYLLFICHRTSSDNFHGKSNKIFWSFALEVVPTFWIKLV